jgi:hypothetical protein
MCFEAYCHRSHSIQYEGFQLLKIFVFDGKPGEELRQSHDDWSMDWQKRVHCLAS